MPDDQLPEINETDIVVNLEEWIKKKRTDPQAYLERQATEILLQALTLTPFEGKVYLKGGVLMGLLYKSDRQTGDVDFTTSMKSADVTKEKFRNQLNTNMKRASVGLGYPDIIMRVQSIQEQPRPSNFATASFPALTFKVGYAETGTPQAKQVEGGNGAVVLEADISFNEPVNAIQVLRVAETDSKIYAYSLIDLIAEKIRAFLQQEIRKRSRRQDIYDLAMLIENFPLDDDDVKKLYIVLIEKCKSRDITPTIKSIRDDALIERAKSQWDTLSAELGREPPQFEACYSLVCDLYEKLPWEKN